MSDLPAIWPDHDLRPTRHESRERPDPPEEGEHVIVEVVRSHRASDLSRSKLCPEGLGERTTRPENPLRMNRPGAGPVCIDLSRQLIRQGAFDPRIIDRNA